MIAAIFDFGPLFKGVFIGLTHCFFWFHGAASPPYDFEVVCSQPGRPAWIDVSRGGSLDKVVRFPAGFISWQVKPNDSDATKIDYQISGQATTDAAPALEVGTL